MGFTSHVFLFVFFLPCLIACMITTYNQKTRKMALVLLLLSDCVFYLWASIDTFFIFLLMILYVYSMGKLIEKTRTATIKYLTIAILIVGINLIHVKYLKQIGTVLKLDQTLLGQQFLKLVFVPVGVSFVTFEAISYFVDIYRGDAESGSLLDTAVFLSFFPKLISGPIVLWKDFNPQLKDRKISLDMVERGVTKVIIGFGKKAIIADSLGVLLGSLNGAIAAGTGPGILWMKALVYTFQLYFDFSGYSDIAIGLSAMLGFTFKENFDHPYVSASITEFWRRWHISLGSWFREYVYFPLGGSRKGNVYLNLMVVFLLTGIWHGDSWAFFLWGLLHGLAVVIERRLMKTSWYEKIPKIIRWLGTMIYVYFLWILFSSDTVKTFWDTVTLMFSRNAGVKNYSLVYFLTPKNITLLLAAALFSVAGTWKWVIRLHEKTERSMVLGILRRALLLVIFAVSLIFVVNSTYSPFLYFQF